MAIASTAKAEVGTIKVALGDVKIIGVDGVARAACVGDKVFAKEVIQTAANAIVQVQLADGRMLDLGRESSIALDDDLLGTTKAAKTASPTDDIAALQAAIAAGADPSKIAEATAAGGNTGGSGDNEGHEGIVVVGQANSSGPVTAGVETEPLLVAFEEPIPFIPLLQPILPQFFSQTLPPFSPPSQPEQLPEQPPIPDFPKVSVQLSVGQNTPPPLPPSGGAPVVKDDGDAIPEGSFVATGNVISGAGTTSGSAGADTPGTITGVTSPTGHTATGLPDGTLVIVGQYGTLTINPDGSYVYDRDPGSPDGVVEKFTYTLTDDNGVTSNADLLIDIGTPVDKPHVRTDVDVVPLGSTVTTGNVITGVGTSSGAAGADTVGSDGATITGVTGVPGSPALIGPGGVITIAGEFGTLVINPDGSYVYNANPGSEGQVDHFTYTLTDGSGDSATGNLLINIGVAPDVPLGRSDVDSIPAGGTVAAGNVITGAGTSSSSAGADTQGSDGATVTGVTSPSGNPATVGPDGVITIVGEFGTLVINPDGSYIYTLNAITTDGLGLTTQDAATIGAAFDTDSANYAAAFAAAVSPHYGADGAGSTTIGGYSLNISDANSGLTSDGQPVTLAQDPLSGDIIGSTPAGEIFRLSVDASGTVTLTQSAELDHLGVGNDLQTALANGKVSLSATATATVTDGDGDSTSAPLTLDLGGSIRFDDDGSVALANVNNVAEGTLLTVNTLSGVLINDTPGADGYAVGGGVVGVRAADADISTAVTNGVGTDISGQYGILHLNADGSYTYQSTANTINANVADVFVYTVRDADGDQATTTLTINVDNGVLTATTDDVLVDEAALSIGSNPTSTDESVSGTLADNVSGGAGGNTYSLVSSPAGSFGTLTLNADGIYSYTLTSPVTGVSADNGTNIENDRETFTYRVTDINGNVANGSITVDIRDDIPSVSAIGADLPSLTVDESNLAVNATASFANNFSQSFGADGAGTLTYTLSTSGGDSGLTDVATGQAIVLVQNGNSIEGHVGNAAGATAFVITVAGNGEVTLDQQRALTHPNAANADDAVSLAAGAIILTASATDKDGDSASAPLQIGNALTFKDDGPSITVGTVAGSVEEEALAGGNQDASDIPNTGAVASGTLTGLAAVGADGGNFALDSSAIASLNTQGLKSDGVTLTYAIAGDTLTAKAGTLDVFTLQVTSAGAYTFTLKDQLDHAAGAGENTLAIQFGGLIKVTDRDGDSITLGGATGANFNITVQDDIPIPCPGTVGGAVEEEALAGGNQDGSDIPNTGLAASGSLTGLAAVGADAPGIFALGNDFGSLINQNLASNGVTLTYSVTGDTLTAKAGTLDVFTLQVTSAGAYTFTLKDQLDHAAGAGENTLAIQFSGLVKVTDRDGDSITLGGTTGANFNITVQDYIPIPCPGTITASVDEDGLVGANADAGRTGEVTSTGLATVTGAAGALAGLASAGADQIGSFSFGSDLSSLTSQHLMSRGVELTYSVSGDTLTATAGVGGAQVFTLQVTSAGGYTFTLKVQLDHPTLNGLPGDNSENSLDINFGGVLKVTDRDGDSITLDGTTGANFNIRVQDDVPVVLLDTGNVAQGATLSVGAANGVLANDRVGADEPLVIKGVRAAGGDTTTPATSGVGTEIAGTYGTLTLNADGGYSYRANSNPVAGSVSFIVGDQGNEYISSDSAPLQVRVTMTEVSGKIQVTLEVISGFIADLRGFFFNMDNDSLIGTLSVSGADVTAQAYDTDGDGIPEISNVNGSVIKPDAYDAGLAIGTAGASPDDIHATTFVIQSSETDLTLDMLGTIAIRATSVGDDRQGSTKLTGEVPGVAHGGPQEDTFVYTVCDADGDTASAVLKVNVDVPVLVVGQNVNDQAGQTAAHKVDTGTNAAGQITGGAAGDVLIGDVGGSSLNGKSTNVVLMLDTSGSMTTAFGTNQPSRLDGMKAGVNSMLDSLANSGALNVRVHLNDFASTLKGSCTLDLVINGVIQDGTGGAHGTVNQLGAAHNYVNGLAATGYTNYEAALQDAVQWKDGLLPLSNGPVPLTVAGVINQAVFISDGVPNSAVGDGSAGSLTATRAIDNIYGRVSGVDSTNEQGALDAWATGSGGMQAIGMGLNATDLAVLSQVEGENAGSSATNTTNTTNLAEFSNVLASVTAASSLGAAGNDVLVGGAGGDRIFGDAVNTDVLGAARGLGLPAGSGWAVFEALEAGYGWTGTDTLNYIRTHTDELAAESTGLGGVKRTGGNDTIHAGAGDDKVYGQEGNDIIVGGAGNDILSGGTGADTFKWMNADKGAGANPAVDTIKDFNPTTTDVANKDVLDLRDLLQGENASNLSSYLSFTQTGADVTLSVHSASSSGPIDQKIVLQGVTMAQLAGSNTADSAGVIANLLANNKLITD